MKDFALHLEKIAQMGPPSAVSPAQLLAARKAEKEYEGLLKADSPKAYASAVAGGILSGLGLPIAIGMSTIGADFSGKINRLRNQAYLAESLDMFGFGKDSNQIAAAMAHKRPEVSRATSDIIQRTRLTLAQQLAKGPLPGVSESVSKKIVGRATDMIDEVSPQVLVNLAAKKGNSPEQVAYTLNHLKTVSAEEKIKGFMSLDGGYRAMSASGHHPVGMGFPGFDGDEISALIGIGKDLYKGRTGKEITNNAAAIKIISKQLSNSLKSALPLAAVGGVFAALRQSSKAKEIRSIRPPEPPAFGEYR